MKNRTKKYLIFLSIILVIIAWITFLSFFTPSEIIVRLGAENSYIIFFLIAAIGGSSIITASSYYIVVPIFAIAGLNPVFLGLVGGAGVTIGDSIYFYLGSKGKEVSPKKVNKKLERIHKSLEKKPKWTLPIFIYVYSGFIPLPNDIMTFLFGISGHSYKKIFLPLLLGNMTGTMILAYLTILGVNLL